MILTVINTVGVHLTWICHGTASVPKPTHGEMKLFAQAVGALVLCGLHPNAHSLLFNKPLPYSTKVTPFDATHKQSKAFYRLR